MDGLIAKDVSMHKLISAMGCLLIAGLALAYQSDDLVIKVTGSSYDLDKDRKIEALGVCSFSPEAINCWDMEGKPAPAWSNKLVTYFQGSNGSDFSIRFKKKNRLVVFRMTGPDSTSYTIQSARGNYSGAGQISDNSTTETLFWSKVTADPEQTETEMYVNPYMRSEFKSFDLPFKVGEKGTFQGVNFEMGNWKPNPRPKNAANMLNQGFGGSGIYNPGGMYLQGASWTFVLGMEGGPTNFSYQPVGKDGQIIRYVDAKGAPVSAVKYLEGSNNAAPNFGNPPQNSKYFPAMVQGTGQSVPGAFTMLTNVNPKSISAIKVGYSRQIRMLFSGFPLDPKS